MRGMELCSLMRPACDKDVGLYAITASRRSARGDPCGSILFDDLGLGLDDLLAAVVAVRGDVVAQMGLARGRIGRQLLGAQGVVRAALAATGRGDAGFLHCHGIAPVKLCRFVKRSGNRASGTRVKDRV